MIEAQEIEALRLAESLEMPFQNAYDRANAAAELRRQHAEIERLNAEIAADERNLEQLTDDLAKARALNAEMLEALKVLVENGGIGPEDMFHNARDAIAKAEASNE